jgi:hypothetical protein
MASTATVNGVPVPTIPVAGLDTSSLQASVSAIKSNVEALAGVHTKFHTPNMKTAVQIQLAAAISKVQGP